jgi:hypothetical protein
MKACVQLETVLAANSEPPTGEVREPRERASRLS